MATVLKPKAFGSLISDVIRPGLCVGCGGCVASCPILALAMKGEQPAIVDLCINCEICYFQCPVIDLPMARFEEAVFGRTRREDELLGVVRAYLSGRALSPDVRKVAQDGGVVTALLLYTLDSRIIDSAVISTSSLEEPWKPIPKVASTREEIVGNAGTKYTSCPVLLGLAEAVRDRDKRCVAFVGTNCRISAVRKSQLLAKDYWGLGKYVKLSIGLFCFECFTDRLLKEYVPSKGVKLEEVTKFNIKRGQFIAYRDESVLLKVPVKELSHYARMRCVECTDSTADLADISVGGIGSEEGWSTVVVRSEFGERVLRGAVEAGYIEVKPLPQESLDRITKFITRKRERRGSEAH